VFDLEKNRDGLNPLTRLDLASAGIWDDERPSIARLGFRPDELEPGEGVGEFDPSLVADQVELQNVFCDAPVRGKLDVFAEMKDRFFTESPAPDPVPGAIDSVGVFSAELLLRHLQSGQTWTLPWYRFDQAPFLCTGPLRGADCPTPLADAEFNALTFDEPSGSPLMGADYTAALWDQNASNSEYWATETYVHLLSHGWGVPGAWDTSQGPDGLYQVTVSAQDHAGNARAQSLFTIVDNANQGEAAWDLDSEVALRDSPADTGHVPSDLGGESVTHSPDVWLVPAGQNVDLQSDADAIDAQAQAPLSAGTPYDVYVRVSNLSCREVAGVRVRISALPAGLWSAEPSVLPITNGQFTSTDDHPDGLQLRATSRALLGPFRWTPSELDLAAGPVALLAELDSEADPASRASQDAVSGLGLLERVRVNNNLALRNVYFAGHFPEGASLELENPLAFQACSSLRIEVPEDWPLEQSSILLELANDSPVLESWSSMPGVTLQPSVDGSTVVVTLVSRRVTLPLGTLPPGEGVAVKVHWTPSPSSPNAAVLRLLTGEHNAAELTLR
jgi:hypothetical protein